MKGCLSREDGILFGGSSGSAVVGAQVVAVGLGAGRRVLTPLPDTLGTVLRSGDVLRVRPLWQRSALVVGTGGLGSPAAMILLRAGVGRVGLIDGDAVEASNLHRQLLHRTADVGLPKVLSAQRHLSRIAPGAVVEAHEGRLAPHNAEALFRSYDVILDGSDRFETRFLCNDAAVLTRRPLVHAGVVRLEGQVMTVSPFRGACYRCLFGEPPPSGAIPSCSEAGILGPVAGVIGALQAAEALKILSGSGDALVSRLLVYDAAKQAMREVLIGRDPACPACCRSDALVALEPERYAEDRCAA
jgi:adenylyltransferase/sulfurtransferase